MGHGSYSTTASTARATFRASTGTSPMTHDVDVRAGRASALHPSMDLTKKPKRECRDNADNPQAVPIAVLLDVTGSMSSVPANLIKDFGKAVQVIQSKAVEHPAILFGAIGDAFTDRVPIQMGEFESSDELAEQHLSNIFLEGGGGGNDGESYDLALWFFANCVETDSWDKRGDKGFLFVIGDEPVFRQTDAHHIASFIGINSETTPIETTMSKLQDKWNVFVLRPGGTSHFHRKAVKDSWARVLDTERIIDIENWNEIVSMIAGTISVIQGLSVSDTLASLKDAGLVTTSGTSTALSTLSSVATLVASGSTSLVNGEDQGATRL